MLAPEEEPRPASRLRALLEGGAWEPDPADPRRERRALPDGGFEYRAKAGAAPEPPQNRPLSAPFAPPAVDPRAALIAAKRAEVERIRAGGDVNPGGVQPEEPSTWDRVKRSANLVRGGMTEGADFLANLPETAARALASPLVAVDDYQKEQARQRSLQAQIDMDQKLGREQTPERLAQIAKALPSGPKPMPEPEGLSFYGLPEIVDATLQNAREERERLTDEMLTDVAENSGPLDAALVATYGPRFTGNLLDPTMLYAPLKGAAGIGEKALPVAARAAGEVAEAVERPASRLRALLGGAEDVVPTPRPRAVPDEFAGLYRAAIDTEPPASAAVAPRAGLRVEPGPALDGNPVLLARDAETGDTVGRLVYARAPGGGFSVHMVETEGRGTGAARQLYKTAATMEGPYRGSVIRTGEGDALVARLRETDPDIFGSVRPDALPGGGGRPAQAGGIPDGVGAGGDPGAGAARPAQVAPPERPPLPATASLADDLPGGAGLRPREPEIGAPAAAGEPVVARPAGWDEGFRVPRPGDADVPGPPRPPVEPPPALPGMEPPAGPPPRPPMSTKGLETFKDPALREGMEKVGEESFDEIYAARGAPVPVSQWHDAPGLQRKLKLAPEDYLAAPVTHTFSADELALGKHYLGAMKRDAQALEAKIAAGQVEDLAAAQAELATRNRDVVRMFAVLQGQGSSENARAMRMLQEALDPQGLAETPKERLQLALLKNYGAKNAEAAAAIEQKAVARIRAQAARETRKAARAATKEELASEFGDLLGELDALTKRPKGMGGGPVPLDPELVAVIGKLAKNRIKAGVVAVEDVADAVYMAIRDRVDVSREQVKASIVEHALAKPAKPSTDPAARRLKTAETAAARRVKLLEEKVAAGPKLKSAPSPADSVRLSALRQRAADLKSQIAKDPKHALVQRYRELLDEDMIDRIAKLPDPAENPDALLNFVRSMERPTFRDYAGAIAYNNILSAPKSLLKNVVGNTVKRWERVAMQPLASVIEQVVAPLQGRLPERYVREIVPMIAGSYRGAPEALQKGLWTLKNGWDPQRLIGDLTGVKGNAKYYEGRLPLDPFLLSQNKAVRVAGAIHGYGPRLMQVGDVMARTRNFSSASYAWATRKAINESKSGLLKSADAGATWTNDIAARAAQLLEESPDEMIEYAQRVAREDVFQDEVSNIAKLLGAGRREDTGVGFVLNQIVRFLNVPDRIMAWIGDYTPGLRIVGAAWKGGKLRKAWGTPEASDLLARQAFGTALAAAGAAWAFQGKLTGNMPRDKKLKNDAYDAGKQPNSALVSGYWLPIRDLFGGWAGPIVAGAAFHDAARAGEEVDGEELLRRAGGAALGEARFMLDAGYLSSLSDTVGAIQAEPDQAGREMVGLTARTFVSPLIPWSGAQRNVATFLDPRVVDKDGLVDELKAGIPGLRETLPSRLGALDEPLKISTGAAGGFSPVVPTKSTIADPALEERVGRLRYTVERKRTEINRALADIKDARKLKDKAREAELLASIPRSPSDRTQGDAALARVRGLEQQIRKLRANEKIPEAQRRAREIALQKRMEDILSKALARLGGSNH